ncbi:MAG: hypothetical protein ACOC0Z_02850, partial [Halohasta sp.]
RHAVALAVTASLAGCAGFAESEPSRLDLSVQNNREEPVEVAVTVVDDAGTSYEETTDRLESGVSRLFEVEVGETGRHELTVTGDDWSGRLAWHAETCKRYDGTVSVTPDSVDVAGECAELR